jgi:hypothetical protein
MVQIAPKCIALDRWPKIRIHLHRVYKVGEKRVLKSADSLVLKYLLDLLCQFLQLQEYFQGTLANHSKYDIDHQARDKQDGNNTHRSN